MPEKSHTLEYAAGASLAAIALVYVFAPTFFLDSDSGSTSTLKTGGVVGLLNPANDCFINSVLQALAGLGDLRIYLIRETHRRKLDGPEVYSQVVDDPAHKGVPEWKLQGLQSGLVTRGLKTILDALNERPLYKKNISAAGFVAVLESAFRQRISRQQQDAQEFLQVVAERLCDEYHAGHWSRKSFATFPRSIVDPYAGESQSKETALEENRLLHGKSTHSQRRETESSSSRANAGSEVVSGIEVEEGFPLEGASESQIECLTCGFKPQATKTTFCTLTMSVPQVTSTSLNKCYDAMFHTEFVDDFKCEKCRLMHAMKLWDHEMKQSTSKSFKTKTQEAIDKLRVALETNPEHTPKGVELPDIKLAPKRRIAKHIRITRFPKVLAIHLSRSIFDAGRSTLKNSAKISFPERLPLGGLLSRRDYKLVSLVCHKGSHYSGHYESFRRQTAFPPYSTPNTFQRSKVYSNITEPASPPPYAEAANKGDSSTVCSTPEVHSPKSVSSTSLANSNSRTSPESTQITIPSPQNPETGSLRSMAQSAKFSVSSKVSSLRKQSKTTSPASEAEEANGTESEMLAKENSQLSLSRMAIGKRKKRPDNVWIRISDDKSKESSLKEVLVMEKEVYLLFYELEDRDAQTRHQ